MAVRESTTLSEHPLGDDGTIRVLVADADDVARARYVRVLSTETDIEVVGQCGEGADLARAARRLGARVAVVDVRSVGPDVSDVVRLLDTARPAEPAVKVVLVAPQDHFDHVDDALRSGASGVLLRDSGPSLLVEAVRAAAAGQVLISPATAVRLLHQHAPPPSAGPLTARELDVVRLVARGLTNTEIAEQLFITLSTVKSHVSSAQTKLGARNRVDIAVWAWRRDESGSAGSSGRRT